MRATMNVRSAKRRSKSSHKAAVLLLCAAAVACEDETVKSSSTRCAGGVLEADLESSGWMGAGVDAQSGALRLSAGRKYMVSSTYGVPVPGPGGAPVTEEYGQLFAAIEQQLATQPGLVALQLGSSSACGSGRTLAVWESEEAMYDFVISDAHSAAMAAVGEVLKPGYGVTHWEATGEAQISFAVGAQKLAREAED